MPIDKNLPPITVDNEIDDDGGNLWSLQLNVGQTPNRAETKIDGDESFDTLSLDDPTTLAEGLKFSVQALGPEISKTLYDNRQRARCVLFTRSYNSPDSDRFNSLITGEYKAPGTFQKKTYHEILKDISSYLADNFGPEYQLKYDDDSLVQLPANFAGEIRFENTDVVSAINQLVESAGGFTWTVDLKEGVPNPGLVATQPDDLYDNKIRIIDFSNLGEDKNYGELGVNVQSADFTGADSCDSSGVMVTDKEGRGLKLQFGGPEWWAATGDPGQEIPAFGAAIKNNIRPLHLSVKQSTLDALNDITAYDMEDYILEGGAGYKIGGNWGTPTDAQGNIIEETVVLSLNGGSYQGQTLEPQLTSSNGELAAAFNAANSGLTLAVDTSSVANVPPGFQNGDGGVRLFGFDQKLLTHSSVEISVEAYHGGAPELLFSPFIHSGEGGGDDALDRELLSAKVQNEYTSLENSGRYREVRTIRANFTDSAGNQGAVAYIVGLPKRRWIPITGLKVDLRQGLVFLPTGSILQFGDWSSNPSFQINTQTSDGKPRLFVNHTLQDAIINNPNSLRMNCVLSAAIDPVVRGDKPYHNIRRRDYRIHNVPANVDGDDKEYQIENAPSNDRALMEVEADSLLAEDIFNSSSKGSINVYPGDHNVKLGELSNGGAIVGVKHDYVPYFKTSIELVQDSGFISLESYLERRRINELANRSEVSPDSILKKIEATAISQSVGGGSSRTVSDHTHSGAPGDGGQRLGNIIVDSITILGTKEVREGGVNTATSAAGTAGLEKLKPAILVEDAGDRGYIDFRYDGDAGSFFTPGANIFRSGNVNSDSIISTGSGSGNVHRKFWVAEWPRGTSAASIDTAVARIESQLPSADSASSITFFDTEQTPLYIDSVSYADGEGTNQSFEIVLEALGAIADAAAGADYPVNTANPTGKAPSGLLNSLANLSNDLDVAFDLLGDTLEELGNALDDIAAQQLEIEGLEGELGDLSDEVDQLGEDLDAAEEDIDDLEEEVAKLKKNKKASKGEKPGEGPSDSAPDSTPAGPGDINDSGGTTPPVTPLGPGSPTNPGGDGSHGPGSIDGGPAGGGGGKATDNKQVAGGLDDVPVGGNDTTLGSVAPGGPAGAASGPGGSQGASGWMGTPSWQGGDPCPTPLFEPDNIDYTGDGGPLNVGSTFNPETCNPVTIPIGMPQISRQTAKEIWAIGGGGGKPAGLIGVSTDSDLPQPDPNKDGFDTDHDQRNPFIWANRTPTVEMDATGRLIFVGGGHIFPTMINQSGEIAISDDESADVNIGGLTGTTMGQLEQVTGIEIKPQRIVGRKAFGMVGVINDTGDAVIVNSQGLFHAELNEEGKYQYADNSEVVLGGQIRKIRNQIDRYDGNVAAEAPGLFSATGNILETTHTLTEAILAMDQNSPKNNYSASTAPTANDDADDGYEVGSIWTNTTSDATYVCIDASVSSAVWHQLSGFTNTRVPFAGATGGLIDSSSLIFDDTNDRLAVGDEIVIGDLTTNVGIVTHPTPFAGSVLNYGIAIVNASGDTQLGLNASSGQYVAVTFDGGTGAGGGNSHTPFVFTEGGIRMYEQTAGGTNFINLAVPTSLSTDYTVTLPSTVGAKNEALITTDTSGTVDFKNPRVCDDIQNDKVTYTVLATDGVIGCNTASSDVAITLEEAATYGYGKPLWIKDNAGNASGHNISISRAGSDTIDGATSITISSDYGAVMLMALESGEWSIMVETGTIS